MQNLINFFKSEKFFYAFIVVFIVGFVLTHNTIDMDYWARLIQGNAFWQTGNILKQDMFSYIPTHTWLDHEWGSSVIFSFFQGNFGFNSILFLRTIIVFAIFFFIFRAIKIINKKTNIILNLIYFTVSMYALVTISQSGLRCHFFTFLFFSLYLLILETVRSKNKDKLLILLPIIMLFWANIHGGCVAGLGLVGMYAIGEFFNKKPALKYIYTLIACLLVLFINPYGFDYVKFIFMATTMKRPFVTEWISPFLHPDWKFLIEFKLLYLLNIILLLTQIKNIKQDYTKYIILLICAVVSAFAVKNTPFFIIVSMIFFYENIYNLLNPLLEQHKKIIWLLFILFTILCPLKGLFKNIETFPLSQQPVKVVEFFKINDLRGNILAPFDYGSYIIYKLYPNNLIYMDGRYEEVYYAEQKDLIDNFYNLKANWAKIIETTPPDYIIVPIDAMLNDYIPLLNKYNLIYNNDKNCVWADKSKIKKIYKLPSNDNNYYLQNAFKTNIKFQKIN